MSFSGLLQHTVEVYRRTAGTGEAAVDRFGQKRSQNPLQHTTGGESLVASYPCRAFMTAGGLKMNEATVDTFEREFKMFTELGVDINEDDALRVVDGNGHVIFGLSKIKDAEVKYQYGTAHHVEYTVWEQAGPGTVSDA